MPLCNAKKTIVLRSPIALLRSLTLVGSLAVLTACADSWPESLDPSDWYATSMGEEAAPRSDEPVPGADEDFPNLAEVPGQPANVSTPEEIDEVARSLSADLANAQYTSGLQRADDETTPQAMPLPQPEVAGVAEDTTYIEPGGEIEIAEAQAMPEPVAQAPEVVEVEEAVVVEEFATPPAETAEMVEVAEMDAVVLDEQPQPEPEAVVGEPESQSRVETDTIRDEDGELVGTVTRVVTSQEVVVDVSDEPVVVEEIVAPAVEEPQAELAEPAMSEPAMAEPPMEGELVIAPAPEQMVTPSAEAGGLEEVSASGGGSLVAQSERDEAEAQVAPAVPQEVVVVPEYAADLAVAEVEAVEQVAASSAQAGMASAAEEDVAAASMAGSDQILSSETRVQQETVVDNATGEVVGSVTRSVAVVETVHEAPVGTMAAAQVAEETMTVEDVAQSLQPAGEPAVQAVTTSVPEPTGQQETANVVTVPAQELDFTELLSASGPGAGTATQPIVIATAEPVGTVDAAFTAPGAGASETLAAIIRFGDGSSSLGAVERDIVRQLALIHADRGGRIRLVGHASRPAGGMETANQQLVNFNISLDRAVAVAEELIRQGVPRGDVAVEGAGDSQAGSDAAQDRRVDVLFGT